jgi:putative colanic acid biosynthesis acetyltransferase WcaF
MGLKAALLRLFGARVGRGLYIRPGVSIHDPRRLTVGDHVWIGDDCVIHNMADVEIQSHAALAHQVFIAAAGHDISSPSMAYAHKPVVIEGQTWLASRSVVLAGVRVREGCVIAAGTVVSRDTPPWTVMAGNPARPLKERRIR